MEIKFEEANKGILKDQQCNKEDISINVEEKMELIDQQGSESRDMNTCCPRSEYNRLVNSIYGKLDKIHPSVSSEYCIYRVPQKIRKLKEEAYHPRVISIGPFHHGDESFKSMEAFKMRYLKKVVQRSTGGGVGLEKYVEYLKDQEANVRQCYSEIIEMGSDEFVTMLLHDGCFIIELFLCYYYWNFRDVDYYILRARRLCDDIRHDLILLENQIPFFVLEGLYNLAMINLVPTPLLNPAPLLNLAISFFQRHNAQNKSPDDINSINHFTDLVLIFHRPTSPRIPTKEYQNTKTATELDEAGMKFKTGSSNCLLDIKFGNGVLEIPRIELNDETNFLVRNLMALEICHYPNDSYMIDYFTFMDYLVNTPKDVDLLVQSGIIDNWLGDSQRATDLINNMNINITITCSKFYFTTICEELNAYCKIPKHKWRAALMREYFSSPWRSASSSAAIVLLVLTLIQTVCSLLSAAN